MTAAEVVEYAEKLHGKLRSFCLDNVDLVGGRENAQEMLQESSEVDSNEQPRHWETMQEILNEEMEEGVHDNGSGDGVDEHMIDLENHNKKNDLSSATKKGGCVRPRSRRIISPVKDTDYLGPAIAGDARSNGVPPSTKESQGAAGSTRKTAKSLSRSKRKVSPSPKPDLHPCTKNGGDEKNVPHPKRNEEDDIQSQNGVVLQEGKASPEQSISTRNRTSKRKQQERNEKNRVEGLTTKKAKESRRNVSRTRTCVGDKCPIRRSTRSRNNTRVMHSRKGGESLVTQKTGDDDDFQTEHVEENEDDEEVQPVQASSSKALVGNKKVKGRRRRIGDAPCPEKITVIPGDRPQYQCNVCKRKFSIANTSYLLKYHGMFCSDKNRPFVCEECGKGFFNRKSMADHTRIHTGDKPFKCLKCLMRFAQKANLREHLRAHARGTSYVCKACDLSFVSPNKALHNHNLGHDWKLPFPCNYCNERFSTRVKLKAHVAMHSDERPYTCPTCKTPCANMHVLSLHLQKLHNHRKEIAEKLVTDVGIDYLIRETNDQSCREMRDYKINSLVLNHVIKKANLELPDHVTNVSANDT